jgi:succinylglutamate desuccinylase
MPDVDAARRLAQADFSATAHSFAKAGFAVHQPEPGILQITLPGASRRLRLLLSVGIHGDETAPIEMLASLLDGLAKQPSALQADLMIAVGNLQAIALGRRYVDADLNRLFANERGDLHDAKEAARADEIMRASVAFFDAAAGDKWHLDLHTAIRASRYPAFAVMPKDVPGAGPPPAGFGGLAGRSGDRRRHPQFTAGFDL